MRFLDPRNPNPAKNLRLPRIGTLEGARIAFLNNGWLSMRKIGQRIEGPLKLRYHASEVAFYDVPRNAEPPDGLLDRVAREYDAAIVGLAN